MAIRIRGDRATSAAVTIACSAEECNGGGIPVRAILEVGSQAELQQDLETLKEQGWHVTESGSMCPACVKRLWGKT
jgi:hypothetical protein